MNCNQFRKRLLELGAPEAAAVAAHLDSCVGCAAIFQQNRALEAGLKQMAARQVGWSAPPRVEAALVERFRSQTKLQPAAAASARTSFRTRFRLPGLAVAGALAAGLALLLIPRAPHSPHMVEGTPSQISEVDDDSALDNGFVLLPYANSGEIGNAAEADVVRVEMPRSALVTLGVPVSDDGNSATVEADLLLGEGGVPQAVRVLE
jgi:hypothetical protein